MSGSLLHAWLSELGGGFHPNVSFTRDSFGSRVIAGDQSLPKDLIIVSCPFSLAITQPVAQRAVLETLQIPTSENIQWSERQWISTYISLHWILASKDNIDNRTGKKFLVHTTYLNTLPIREQLRTPLHFTPPELDIFKGTNLYGAALDRDRLWRIEWTACQTLIGRANANWANLFTWQRYLTAATYLSSRAFPSSLLLPTPSLAYSPASQPILLPGVDALNHARGQPVSWVVTYPDTNDTSQEPKISLVLHTATSKGDELFNNYGPKPNSELILGYGFSIPRNPDDTIVLKIGGSLEDGKKWEIGREARGVEDMWTDLMKAFIQDSSQDPTYEDMLDASNALQEMVQDLINRLPADKTAEMTDIRVEVRAMFRDYLEGQRDILRSLMEFAKAQERRALDTAQEEGVEIVFGDEED